MRRKLPLLTTAEGRILFAGIIAALIGFALLFSRLGKSPQEFSTLMGLTVTNIVAGRAAGISYGFAAGMARPTVLIVNAVIETILVLLFYPIFVFALQRVMVIRALNGIVERTRATAETHEETLQRYGLLGLFAFVWIPFWMTGPLVGCAIGYMIGLRARTTLCIVLIGTYLAIACWAYALDELTTRLGGLSTFGPVILVGLLLAAGIAGHFLHIRRHQDD